MRNVNFIASSVAGMVFLLIAILLGAGCGESNDNGNPRGNSTDSSDNDDDATDDDATDDDGSDDDATDDDTSDDDIDDDTFDDDIGDDLPDQYGGYSSVEIAENAFFIEDSLASMAVISSDSIVFPGSGADALDLLQPGDIIYSTYGNGFSRKVLELIAIPDAVTGKSISEYIVETVAVGIAELCYNCDVSYYQALDPINVVDGDGTILYEDDGGWLGSDLSITLTKGHVRLTPSFFFRLKTVDGVLEEFRSVFTGPATAAIEIEAEAREQLDESGSDIIDIAPLAAIPIPGLPVVLTPHLALNLGYDVWFDAVATVSGGGLYFIGGNTRHKIF
ncbi:MAG: hypothetical protein IT350_06375 [Deltaproteobacteria bacterium]|nr:hypothetical protein [Deltaproteobacteria bacterium]